MQLLSFEELIRSHIQLSKRPNSNGWWGVLCKVCNDHGKKGKRAGFKFEATNTGYNCFNCGHTAMYEHSHTNFSKDMVEVLDAFNIPQDARNEVLFQALANREAGEHDHVHTKRIDIEPKSIILPPFFTPLTSDSIDEIDQYAREYLLTERSIACTDYPFYIGRKSNHPDSKKWYARLVVPIFKDNNLIFYFGRDLTGTRTKKYMSPDVPRESIIYGYDELFRETTDPLYIAEGWFDVFHIKGVAVFGNRMTANQISWLNRSPRTKVVIPDRFGDGHLLAEQAVELGWCVSTPDIGDCKDVDEAIRKYGLIYTQMSIKKHTYEGFEALVRIQSYCSHDNRTSKKHFTQTY
jgi:hypothetical protein